VALNWSTFILEIVNFLVLVWILQRFFYKPVLEIIARRRSQIEESLQEARNERQQAERLQQLYEGRLSEWEKEKQAARMNLERDLDAERARRLAEIKTEIGRERQKAQAVAEQEQERQARLLEQQAIAMASSFGSRMLSRIAGPELERQLVEAALQDLRALPDHQREQLRQAWGSDDGPLTVTTAYNLEDSLRSALETTIGELVGNAVTCSYHEDRALIAGVRVAWGPWVLRANIQDDLKSLTEAARE
jgi:F-type H+-transporting ATPase subunit b